MVAKTIYHPDEKLWTGPQITSIYNPNASLGEIMLKALQRDPRKIGQISHNGPHLTNQEIRTKAIQAYHSLAKLGLTTDSVCGFYTKNTPYLASVVFGCLTLGAAVNAIDPRYKRMEICHMFEMTRPAIVFCDVDNAAELLDALDKLELNIPVFSMAKSSNERLKDVHELFAETNCDDEFIPPSIGDGTKRTAFISCSSGTSGVSKSIYLSHAACLYYFDSFAFSAEDILLCFSPLYWLTGIHVLLIGTLVGATRIITEQSFSSNFYFELLDTYKFTFSLNVSNHLADILSNPRVTDIDFNSLKYFIPSGTMTVQQYIDEMNELLPNGQVYVMYGITETSGMISSSYPQPRPGSVGQLVRGTTIKIVNDSNENCGIGVEGELCIKRLYPFLGYGQNEAEYAEAVDADGFFHTGDMGYFDADGYLFLVDRKKDIFKYNNSQIAPSEIEAIILQHPCVSEACVVGIPNAIHSYLPAAVVTVTNGSKLNINEIHNLMKENLSDAKQLRGGIFVVDEIPKTGSGKVLRRIVAAELLKKINTNHEHEKNQGELKKKTLKL